MRGSRAVVRTGAHALARGANMQTKTDHQSTSSADELGSHDDHGGDQDMERKMYLRFAAMILTSTLIVSDPPTRSKAPDCKTRRSLT